MTIASDTPDVKGENLTSPSDFVRDPRTCAVCVHWRPFPDGSRGECVSEAAIAWAGFVGLITGSEGGCRFWELTWEEPVGPEWKRLVIEQASRVAYHAMVHHAGRTRLPDDVRVLDEATRKRVESVAVHLLNSLGFFRP